MTNLLFPFLLSFSNYCNANKIKPLSQADFGKVMKQVYPKVRARRLGTRGNSRYCYSGLKRRHKLDTPVLPDLADKPLVISIFYNLLIDYGINKLILFILN